MNMATQLMQDPQMQNVMSNLVTSMFPQGGAGTSEGASETPAAAAEAPAPGYDQILNS